MCTCRIENYPLLSLSSLSAFKVPRPCAENLEKVNLFLQPRVAKVYRHSSFPLAKNGRENVVPWSRTAQLSVSVVLVVLTFRFPSILFAGLGEGGRKHNERQVEDFLYLVASPHAPLV